MGREIDHLVYVVQDLEAAVLSFAERSGALPVLGGRHLRQGTKNALLHIGGTCYLEFLAIDPQNTDIGAPRWMGVDLVETPCITRWSLKSSDLEADSKVVRKFHPQMGMVQGGSRQMSDGNLLTWDMVMPLSQPAVELIPFMTDWSRSNVHPTDSLTNQCRLLKIVLKHPNPKPQQKILEMLGVNQRIEIGYKISISLEMECPKGIIRI